jgi:threonine dehydrogenase-like Zn-dependent dehydrogenase
MVVGWADGKNALADYVMLESRDVIAYDPVLSPVEAIVIQPLACVLHALWQIGDVRGKTAAVIGQGAIGLLFSHAAKSLGARRVIGIDRIDRSGRSGAFGVDEVVHLASDQWALGLTDHERPDVVIEAVGHQVGTLADAIDAVAFGGSILYFGIPDDVVYPVSVHGLIRKNLTLTAGTVPPDLRRRFLAEAEAYLLKHRALAGTLVTHRFSFEESAEAYRAATVPVSDQHKVVVELTPA